MSLKDGGPAFPRPHSQESVLESGCLDFAHQTGMTLRDYFAAKAMQGFAADPSMADTYVADVARQAYELADAMLKAREK